MAKQTEGKVTIGCRVTTGELEQIDAIASEAGMSRAQWLAGVVGEALGQQSAETVRALSQRVAALERKLQLLAK